jgi:hypothetical protein
LLAIVLAGGHVHGLRGGDRRHAGVGFAEEHGAARDDLDLLETGLLSLAITGSAAKAAEEMARVERAAQAAARVWSFTRSLQRSGRFRAQELGYRPRSAA